MRLLKEIGCGHAGNGNSHGDEEEKGGAIEMACVVVRFGGLVKCRIVCKWSLFLYVFTVWMSALPAGVAYPSVRVLPCPDT